MVAIVNKEGLMFEVSEADLKRFLANGWKVAENAAAEQAEEAPKPKRTTKKK